MKPARPRSIRAGCLALAGLLVGCTSSSGGFDWVGDVPADPIAHYRASVCTDTSSGSAIELDDPMDYYLAENSEGPVLYQFHRQQGARLTSSYRGDGTLHYVYYMEIAEGSVGHELVVPDDRTQAVVHLVYLGDDYEIYEDESDGTLRVRGEPDGRCVVEPVVAAAS